MFVFLSLVTVSVVLSTGCTATNESHEHIVYHHKPKDFVEATKRLVELHEAIVADAPLPSPREFDPDLIEDGHGHDHDHGHSDEDEHDHEHDHDHHEKDEMVKVGVFQEYEDIVRWLPTIAADSDLPKAAWDPINESSEKLYTLVQPLKGLVPQSKRSEYKKIQAEIEALLNSLEASIESFKEWDEKFPG